jgi:hypothetical protein
MKSHAVLVIAVVLSAITVELAARMVTAVELYLLSSSIGDWIEKKPQANQKRLLTAMGLALAIVLYLLIARAMAK